MDKKKRTSRMSGALGTLRRKQAITYIENNIGTRLFGLEQWFDGAIPSKYYIDKMIEGKYNPEKFGIQLTEVVRFIDPNANRESLTNF